MDLAGAWVTPGLIDCHTHLVFGGDRADEFELRLQGVAYAEIARRGGGIRATVAATRAASEDAAAGRRPRGGSPCSAGGRRHHGRDQVRLRPRSRAASCGCCAWPRALGRAGRRRRRDQLPRAARAAAGVRAATAAAYVELVTRPDARGSCRARGSPTRSTRSAKGSPSRPTRWPSCSPPRGALGLPVKLHADQLSDLGGAALAARFGALSADHVEHTGEAGRRAMAAAGTVAVLLPGAFYLLRETQRPPVEAVPRGTACRWRWRPTPIPAPRRCSRRCSR